MQISFKTLDLRHGKVKGRPFTFNKIRVPLSYTGLLGINPLKKRDLLSMITLIDDDCRSFYQNLRTTDKAPEFDELQDDDDPDADD